MGWRAELTHEAERQIGTLGAGERQRVLKFLQKLQSRDDPEPRFCQRRARMKRTAHIPLTRADQKDRHHRRAWRNTTSGTNTAG